MGLEIAVQTLLQNPSLTNSERAVLLCALAKELEEVGRFEDAREALSEWWQGTGDQPELGGLDQLAQAEVLMRVGALTGRLGSARQIANSQELAKNLISQSIDIFEAHREKARVGTAQTELAYCYWREGAYDEARIILHSALQNVSDEDRELKAWVLLRMAIVECTSLRLEKALGILEDSARLFEASGNAALKGNFHNTLALVLRNIGTNEDRPDLIDRAIIEYTAAGVYLEQAGNMRHLARVENNLGFLSFTIGRFDEAHAHLDRARNLFIGLNDNGSAAQVDETRARTFLSEKRNADAEKLVNAVVCMLEQGGEQAVLAEALTTHGSSLARLQRYEEAHAGLERAMTIAETAGDTEGAGRAAITLIEELHDHLTRQELQGAYERADKLIGSSQHKQTLARLRGCARHVIAAPALRSSSTFSSYPLNTFHGSSKTTAVIQHARRVAEANSAVLITGEAGTGKEALARLIHGWSGRQGKFVVVDCASLPDSMVESLFFGHRTGAFKGASGEQLGAAREADGGSLFLTAVNELSMANQSKLLRLVDTGEIYPIGVNLPEHVDVRIIAAATQGLEDVVSKGNFRDALYYRLNVLRIDIPPLRERPEDVDVLARQFISEVEAGSKRRTRFIPECIVAMQRLPLFGNVRELQSLIERLALEHEGGTVTVKDVEAMGRRAAFAPHQLHDWEPCDLNEEVRQFERAHIKQALQASGGRITKAAKLLGLKHHQSLMTILNTRHQDLLASRLPARKRHRSIIKKPLTLVKSRGR